MSSRYSADSGDMPVGDTILDLLSVDRVSKLASNKVAESRSWKPINSVQIIHTLPNTSTTNVMHHIPLTSTDKRGHENAATVCIFAVLS